MSDAPRHHDQSAPPSRYVEAYAELREFTSTLPWSDADAAERLILMDIIGLVDAETLAGAIVHARGVIELVRARKAGEDPGSATAPGPSR